MNPHKNTMVVLGQIIKLIPPKLIEKLKNKHNIQTLSTRIKIGRVLSI